MAWVVFAIGVGKEAGGVFHMLDLFALLGFCLLEIFCGDTVFVRAIYLFGIFFAAYSIMKG